MTKAATKKPTIITAEHREIFTAWQRVYNLHQDIELGRFEELGVNAEAECDPSAPLKQLAIAINKRLPRDVFKTLQVRHMEDQHTRIELARELMQSARDNLRGSATEAKITVLKDGDVQIEWNGGVIENGSGRTYPG